MLFVSFSFFCARAIALHCISVLPMTHTQCCLSKLMDFIFTLARQLLFQCNVGNSGLPTLHSQPPRRPLGAVSRVARGVSVGNEMMAIAMTRFAAKIASPPRCDNQMHYVISFWQHFVATVQNLKRGVSEIRTRPALQTAPTAAYMCECVSPRIHNGPTRYIATVTRLHSFAASNALCFLGAPLTFR